jgi:large subunit ribosomal protein L25
VKLGGVLDQQLTTLHVEAEATNIPAGIEVDLSSLTEIGAHGITAGGVSLPTGTTLLTDPDAIVVHVVGPQAAPAEEEAAEAAEAEGEAAAAEPAAE